MSMGRDVILKRVRAAMRQATHRPDHPRASSEPSLPATAKFRDVLPPVGASMDERLDLFARHAVALKATFIRVADMAAMIQSVRSIAHAETWRQIGTHRGSLADPVAEALELPTTRTDDGYDPEDLERCDASITECEALIAQTGSVLVTTRSSGGRALSALPPHHVVLARVDQLLPDVLVGYEHLEATYGGNRPSWTTLITGPSRTGDIERILVLGAHGPKRLTIVLVG